MVLQETLGLALKIEPGLDTEPDHLPGGRRPDAVKLPHRQRLDEGRPHFRRDHEQPWGLRWSDASLARNLLWETPAEARELGLGANRGAYFFRDLCRGGDAFEVFGDVEIGLLERQGLDDRRVSGEDLPDLQEIAL
jgi:hypothetical protein